MKNLSHCIESWPAPVRHRPSRLRRAQRSPLRSILQEIPRTKPSFQLFLSARPLGIEHGVPSRVAVFAFYDHVLPEDPFEGESKPLRSAPRPCILGVAFPLIAAIAQSFERIASQQIHGFGCRGSSLQGA